MQKNQNQPHKMEEFGIYPIMVFITHRSLAKLELPLTEALSLMEGQLTKSYIYGSRFNQPANRSFDKISTRGSCSNGRHWEDYFQILIAGEHRSLLKFLWWKDGDMSKEIIDHKMCVHVFGGVSSGACSDYALRRIQWGSGGNAP